MSQIPLNLRPSTRPSFANFHVAAGNAAAVTMLRARERWTSPVLLLLAPEGTGKTHLGQAWQSRYRGEFIDNAEAAGETALFDAINRALAGQIPGLLLASRVPPTQWPVTLPDLRSRLNATPTIHLAEHDDATLEPILRELFGQVGREVRADVVDYMLKYADRSVAALRELVHELDVAAGSAKADLTKAFVIKYMKQRSELDLLSGPVE